jgi:D-glycero-D-manno-heptose 1,7-bisphosphate phosphatase
MEARMLRKAVFLDKDGTLIEDVPYNVDPALIRFNPHAVEGLQLLAQLGYLLVVVSNQSGVARGRFAEHDLGTVWKRLDSLLDPYGIDIEGYYFCPHHPEGEVEGYAFDCECRKPQPGLLQQAAREHAIDLAASWMVGDILNDIEAGHRAGCRTVLIDNGNETEWLTTPMRMPELVAEDLLAAARQIAALPPRAITPESGQTAERA